MLNPIVRIHMDSILSMCIINTCLTRDTYSTIVLMDNPKAIVSCRIFITNFPAFVRTSVIDKNHFKIIKCLRYKRIQAPAYIGLCTVYGNYDTDNRFYSHYLLI